MTREEAIEEIKRWTPILLNSGQCTEETSAAQDMAISALSAVLKNDIVNDITNYLDGIIEDENRRLSKPSWTISTRREVSSEARIDLALTIKFHIEELKRHYPIEGVNK